MLRQIKKNVVVWAFDDAPRKYRDLSPDDGGSFVVLVSLNLDVSYQPNRHPVVEKLTRLSFLRKRFVGWEGVIYIFSDFNTPVPQPSLSD